MTDMDAKAREKKHTIEEVLNYFETILGDPAISQQSKMYATDDILTSIRRIAYREGMEAQKFIISANRTSKALDDLEAAKAVIRKKIKEMNGS